MVQDEADTKAIPKNERGKGNYPIKSTAYLGSLADHKQYGDRELTVEEVLD